MKKQILKTIFTAVLMVSITVVASAASILKPAKSVFNVGATQADKVYVKLIKDRIQMDSCNYVGIEILDVKDINVSKFVEKVIPVAPIGRKACTQTVDDTGKVIEQVCEVNPIATPNTELVEMLEKTGSDIEAYVYATEKHCPVEPYLATAVSKEVELDITPGTPFIITVPGSVDRLELSLSPSKAPSTY